MKKTKNYSYTFFPPEVLKEAAQTFERHISDTDKKEPIFKHLVVETNGETWEHESEEEFFSDYRNGTTDAVYWKEFNSSEIRLQVIGTTSQILVAADQRSHIQAAFEVFEKNAKNCKIERKKKAEIVPPTIFIGHGRNPQWKELKDHLHEKHGYQIEAYEIGARAGHVIRDILEEMLGKSSFALLVMTAEDETSEGEFRARQNVIHEIGLFQGRLGFSRAIVLLEESTEDFSNLQGIDQIRFSKGNIKETYGEVLATLRREFQKSF